MNNDLSTQEQTTKEPVVITKFATSDESGFKSYSFSVKITDEEGVSKTKGYCLVPGCGTIMIMDTDGPQHVFKLNKAEEVEV